MRALDTNVLVRLLVRDDEQQAQRVRRLLLAAQGDGVSLFVADVVVLELIWVLRSSYGFSRQEQLDALELIADFPLAQLESHDVVRRLIREGRASRTDLADLFIGLVANARGCSPTLTFDRRLAKSDLFEPVPESFER